MISYTTLTLRETVALNDGLPLKAKGSKNAKYQMQKKAAAKRGIAWEISFPEWVKVWNDSGKWRMRGVGRGKYCMARRGDVGPYSLDNVRIVLNEENIRECSAFAKPRERVSKGYTKQYRNRLKPFTVRVGYRIVGHFATEEQAAAARASFLAAHGYRLNSAGVPYQPKRA